MKNQDPEKSKILEAVKEEVEEEKKSEVLRPTSSNCGSYCSGDNYCSDWHDA